MRRVGFLMRAAAVAIDGAAALLILVFSGIIVGASQTSGRGGRDTVWILFLILWIFYTFTEVVFAASPGKLLLGLRIARQNGRDAEMGRRFLRWSTKYYSLVPCIFDCLIPGTLVALAGAYMNGIILCGLLGAFNDDHLTWHDEWSGTAVWSRRGLPPPIPSPVRPALS